MQTRREFVKFGAAGVAGLYVTSSLGSGSRLLAQVPGGTLPPDVIPKFVSPLVIPPAMPLSASDSAIDYYRIGVR